ncbi:FxLD family lanthipeptide [Actinomadura gamaensis]|uniref:FxLD family lanthipeptide n=1 Tax=Actinomadura gamaensis TaxID=1763541 RepID=A0ABV9UBJ9_9ACTN
MENEQEYQLDVRLVDAGPAAGGHATSTDDGCGSGNTGSDACTGNAY